MWSSVDRDRSFRSWSIYQNMDPRWVRKSGGIGSNCQPRRVKQAPHHVPNTSQWCQRVSKLCKKCRDEFSGRRSAVSQNTTKAPRPLQNNLETLAQRAEVLLTSNCKSGGSGFLTKATQHLGLRGYVLDTKFGPRYDVTQPLVLTRIRQDVSAGKCVSGMISLPRQRTSSSSKVISATASIATLLHRARMPWILEHPCDSWLWGRAENPNSCGTASHDLGPCGFLFFLAQSTESERCFWLEAWTAEICTALLANVLGRFLPIFLTMSTRRFQRKSFECNGICTQRVKGHCCGSY